MKKLSLILFLLFSIAAQARTTIKCIIKTSLGDITVELYPEGAS